MSYTDKQLEAIVTEAKIEAYKAADQFFNEKMNGQDNYPCGFAWVNIRSYNGEKLKGNTKIGRALKRAGVEQDYRRVFRIYNPSGINCQNIDVKEVGARAAAEVLKRYGFSAYPDSRLD